ncbi:MAG: hypothetical protein M9916_00740 [Crocinitomicaceae bacterium]|nr:hypothetical protein [Crocinitomicaceae bacterium]
MINKVLIKLPFLREVLLVIILLFVANNFLYKKNLDNKEIFILADGRGYYEYLPALFIYHDIKLDYLDTIQTDFYTQENTLPIFLDFNSGKRINKYYIGTALMQSPFFFIAHQLAKSSNLYKADGYSLIYQKWILYSTIFYMFLGMICLRLFLKTYQINSWWIFISQLILLFATPLLYYTIYDPAYSHTYSFFLIGWFLLAVRNYFISEKPINLVIALFVFGLITIVRPINILIILFTPLLANSPSEFLSKVVQLFKSHIYYFLIGVLLCVLLFSMQFYILYLQTGNPLNYNYGEEGFNFSSPHIIDFLFSYRKGFFLWTPIWFVLFVLGFIHLFLQKKFYHLIAFLSAFMLLVYVLSSWYAWSYGGSIGQRPMIDFYAAFSFLFIPIFVQGNKLSKIFLLLCTPFLIFVMQIQIFQYIKAIISWDYMDKEKYWEVFLNTNEKYSWYFSKIEIKVGENISDTLLIEKIDFKKKIDNLDLQTFKLNKIDTTAKVGELSFNIDRIADREVFQTIFLDSLDNVLYLDYCNFFYNQTGDVVRYKFNLPENAYLIDKVKLIINRVESSIKIDSIRFLTYKPFE